MSKKTIKRCNPTGEKYCDDDSKPLVLVRKSDGLKKYLSLTDNAIVEQNKFTELQSRFIYVRLCLTLSNLTRKRLIEAHCICI